MEAISKAQAVIEFDLNGTIRTANDNFLNTLGYSLSEVQGKHHSMFVEPATSASPEYRKFWDDLKAGIYQAAQYKRVGKGGKTVLDSSFVQSNLRLERQALQGRQVRYGYHCLQGNGVSNR